MKRTRNATLRLIEADLAGRDSFNGNGAGALPAVTPGTPASEGCLFAKPGTNPVVASAECTGKRQFGAPAIDQMLLNKTTEASDLEHRMAVLLAVDGDEKREGLRAMARDCLIDALAERQDRYARLAHAVLIFLAEHGH